MKDNNPKTFIIVLYCLIFATLVLIGGIYRSYRIGMDDRVLNSNFLGFVSRVIIGDVRLYDLYGTSPSFPYPPEVISALPLTANINDFMLEEGDICSVQLTDKRTYYIDVVEYKDDVSVYRWAGYLRGFPEAPPVVFEIGETIVDGSIIIGGVKYTVDIRDGIGWVYGEPIK